MPVLNPNLFERERKRQRLAVVDVAFRTGITVDRYNELVGGADATRQEVLLIAGVLGVEPSDITGGDE